MEGDDRPPPGRPRATSCSLHRSPPPGLGGSSVVKEPGGPEVGTAGFWLGGQDAVNLPFGVGCRVFKGSRGPASRAEGSGHRPTPRDPQRQRAVQSAPRGHRVLRHAPLTAGRARPGGRPWAHAPRSWAGLGPRGDRLCQPRRRDTRRKLRAPRSGRLRVLGQRHRHTFAMRPSPWSDDAPANHARPVLSSHPRAQHCPPASGRTVRGPIAGEGGARAPLALTLRGRQQRLLAQWAAPPRAWGGRLLAGPPCAAHLLNEASPPCPGCPRRRI